MNGTMWVDGVGWICRVGGVGGWMVGRSNGEHVGLLKWCWCG